MPIVRRADRTTSLTALPGARLTAHETPTSQGAGVARAEEELAAGRAAFFGRIAQFGVEQYARMEERARDQADQTAVLEYQNTLYEWEASAIHDPNTGAYSRRGKDAAGLPEEIRASFEKVASEAEAKLGNDRQRAYAARIRQQQWQTANLQVLRHVSREIENHQQQQTEAFIGNATNLAIQSYRDPKLVAVHLQAAEAALQARGRALGWSQDAITAELQAVRSKTHLGVINNLIAIGQDRSAQDYFALIRSEIGGEHLDAVTRALEVSSTTKAGRRAADEVWAQFGPKGDADPIHLDKMEDALRRRFADDEKSLDVAVKFLRERKTAVDVGRKEREEAAVGGLWLGVMQGQTLDDVRRSPAYLSVPDKVKAQVEEFVQKRLEHQADRTHLLAGRARAEVERQRQEQEDKSWAAYWGYTEPSRLAAMSENQILALTPELGIDHVNRLMTQYRSMEKTEARVIAATIDQELFKTIAADAGLPAYDLRATEKERAALGRLQNAVEAAINAEQTAGKPLTRERKEALMRDLVKRKVFLDQWGRDTELIAAIVGPEDQLKAYIPLESIGEDNIADAITTLRMHMGPTRLTDAQIRQRHRRAIERAAAAKAMGLSEDEILARLLNQK